MTNYFLDSNLKKMENNANVWTGCGYEGMRAFLPQAKTNDFGKPGLSQRKKKQKVSLEGKVK